RDGHRPEGVVAFVNTYMPELFLVFSVLFAVVWRRFFQRGPLEALVSNTVRRVTEPLFRATAETADRCRWASSGSSAWRRRTTGPKRESKRSHESVALTRTISPAGGCGSRNPMPESTNRQRSGIFTSIPETLTVN